VSGSPIVLDASAAIALIRREPAAPALDEILRRSAREAVRLVAPEAFWLEIANVPCVGTAAAGRGCRGTPRNR
jgi:predicted nucleic acid-binding protein